MATADPAACGAWVCVQPCFAGEGKQTNRALLTSSLTPRANECGETVMHFFINAFNGSEIMVDPDGGEFPDLNAAIDEAAQSGRDLIAGYLRDVNLMPARGEVRVVDQ